MAKNRAIFVGGTASNDGKVGNPHLTGSGNVQEEFERKPGAAGFFC